MPTIEPASHAKTAVNTTQVNTIPAQKSTLASYASVKDTGNLIAHKGSFNVEQTHYEPRGCNAGIIAGVI